MKPIHDRREADGDDDRPPRARSAPARAAASSPLGLDAERAGTSVASARASAHADQEHRRPGQPRHHRDHHLAVVRRHQARRSPPRPTRRGPAVVPATAAITLRMPKSEQPAASASLPPPMPAAARITTMTATALMYEADGMGALLSRRVRSQALGRRRRQRERARRRAGSPSPGGASAAAAARWRCASRRPTKSTAASISLRVRRWSGESS